MAEQFTLAEVRTLLHKKLDRFSPAIKSTDNSGFARGEKNMAQIVDDFLKNHGNVTLIGDNNMPSVETVSRKDLE